MASANTVACDKRVKLNSAAERALITEAEVMSGSGLKRKILSGSGLKFLVRIRTRLVRIRTRLVRIRTELAHLPDWIVSGSGLDCVRIRTGLCPDPDYHLFRVPSCILFFFSFGCCRPSFAVPAATHGHAAHGVRKHLDISTHAITCTCERAAAECHSTHRRASPRNDKRTAVRFELANSRFVHIVEQLVDNE
jgi:hypothetical protein